MSVEMIRKDEAHGLVRDALLKLFAADDDIVVIEEMTIEKPYGWIVFYNSRCYLETENISHALAGNVPYLVNKRTGCLETLGSSASDFWQNVARYEREHGF